MRRHRLTVFHLMDAEEIEGRFCDEARDGDWSDTIGYRTI